ncbi:MAG: EF-P 5-aminopentanol modification-associated protein YfmH [Thermovenabulum sp.]|uniref:EF-P 5-aminopentanol modification-associated protein YfmH n=1 Tax=Thermovenabulum sp. TaxID=3100335 RepID=UPI003C7E15DC
MKLIDDIKEKVLANGLKVFVLPMKKYNKAIAVYSTKYGSIDSEFVLPYTGEKLKVPEGIAHFLEHKMFDMEYGNAFDKFAEYGAESNAFTSYNNTTYYFSTTSNFFESLKVLLDFVETPYFTEESVEKEKGIITQELRMYEDDPEWQVYLNLLKSLYHNFPVRIDIGGTVESIQKINTELLYKCYETFYHPSNMVLFIIGPVEPKEVLEFVGQHEEQRKLGAQPEIKRIYPEEPETVFQKEVKIYHSVTQPLMLLGFKDVDLGYDGEKLLKKDVIISILLDIMFGKSSETFEKLYEEGLIDDRFGFSFEAYKDYGFCSIGGNTKDPERLAQEIIKSIRKIKAEGLKKEDFEIMKRKFIGDFIQSLNSLDFIAHSFVSYYHRGINMFDFSRVLYELEFDDVMNYLEGFFNEDRMSISMVLPRK